MAIKYFIGCSGWWYKDWVGIFYPPNIPEEKRLKYYSQFFNTTEINVTFYKLPPKKLISSWVKRTPHYFVFSVKAPQELTHKLHFLFAPRIINNFFDRIEPLRASGKLGVILFQAPPEFTKTQATYTRLKDFLRKLPKEYNYAIEFRHHSWLSKDTFELLREYNVAYVIVDEPLLPPTIEITTIDFSYIRFHGRGKKVWYYYDYKEKELKTWAEKIKTQIQPFVKKLFIYFNNHFKGFAPKNAREFISILNLSRRDLGMSSFQTTLF